MLNVGYHNDKNIPEETMSLEVFYIQILSRWHTFTSFSVGLHARPMEIVLASGAKSKNYSLELLLRLCEQITPFNVMNVENNCVYF